MKLGSNLDMDKVIKNLGRKYKLAPHLEAEIGKGEFEWDFHFTPKHSDDAWHPSGDCTPSVHDLWLKATGQRTEYPPSSGLYRTFQVGHWWHQYLQWIVEYRLGFCNGGAVERRGTKRWGEGAYHWVTGSADIAPCSIPGEGDFLVDFKTQRAVDWARAVLPEWSRAKYECQINIYMDFFDLDQALILCVEKDSPHNFKEIEYRRNQDLVDAIYRKWKLVSACLDTGREPAEDEDVLLPIEGIVA